MRGGKESVKIGRISILKGSAPRMTKADFKKRYSERVVGDHEEAWKVYSGNMISKEADAEIEAKVKKARARIAAKKASEQPTEEKTDAEVSEETGADS